jgi:hypothetical protein
MSLDPPAIPSSSPPLPENAQTFERPTTKSEWTLLATLAALCAFALILIGVLAFVGWPREAAAQRIWFLGWMGLLSVAGILLVVIAIASPWVGRVRASGLGANLEVDGQGGQR